jgi:anti-sigma regulatory factor (Ser/Thr protein kinase)
MSHQTSATVPPLIWSCVFPAVPDQVSEARRFVGRAADGHPAADDVITCVSEMATNATLHSRSREPGGHFTVRADLSEDRIRVEVRDQGGEWDPDTRSDGLGGRGLVIVEQLARDWGIAGSSDAGWVVWAEFTPRIRSGA